MKFSIIIPFFNAAPWIERCLDSCLAQDLPEDEYEIVLVNDGSSDDGEALARERLGKRPNVTILKQENKGQAAARNRALDIAVGEFIWFVDADDWIAEKCLGRIYSEMSALDILAISGADWKDGRAVRRFGWADNGPFKGKDLMRKAKINVGTPFTIYRKSLLDKHSLRFIEGIYHEDAEFAPRAYYYAERVGCTDEILYFVYPSPGSTTRSANPKRVFDSIETAQQSLSAFSDNVEKRYKVGFDNLISSDLVHALKNVVLFDDRTNLRIGECVYRNRNLFKHLRRSSFLKFKLAGLVLSVFPRKSVGIMKRCYGFLSPLH